MIDVAKAVSKYKSHQPYKFQYNHLRDDEILSMDRNKNPSQIQRYVPVKEDQIEKTSQL